MTQFPPSPLPVSQEPSMREGHPEKGGVRILTLSPKGFGTFAYGNENDPAEGSDKGVIKIAGDGIYVVDCPLNWPGRLVLNESDEFEIAPGTLIPERYSSLFLDTRLDNPGGSAPSVFVADSPIILAVGSRGHQYRRPGWRYQRFGFNTTGISSVSINSGVFSAYCNDLQLRGYDYWMFFLTCPNAVNGDNFIVETRYTTGFASDGGSPIVDQQMDRPIFFGTGPQTVPVFGGGPWLTQVGDWDSVNPPVSATTNVNKGAHSYNWQIGLPTSMNGGMVPTPLGDMAQTVAFRVQQNVGAARTVTMRAIGAVNVED